jgi:hypothetical protein
MDTFVVRIRESQQSDPAVRGVVDEIASGARTTFHNHEELLMILTGSRPEGARQHAGPSMSPVVAQRGSRAIRKFAVAFVVGLAASLLLAAAAGATVTKLPTTGVGSDPYTGGQPTVFGADAGLDRFLLLYGGNGQSGGSDWIVDTTAGTAKQIALAPTGGNVQGEGAMSADGSVVAFFLTAQGGNNTLSVVRDISGTWTNVPLPGTLLGGSAGSDPLAYEVALSGNGDRLAVAGEIKSNANTFVASDIYLYDLTNDTVQTVTSQVQAGVEPTTLAFSTDGSRLLIAQGGDCDADGPTYSSSNGTVAIDSISPLDAVSPLWDSTGGNQAYTGCGGAALSGDGNTVAFSGTDPAPAGPAVVIGNVGANSERLIDETLPGPASLFQLSSDGSEVSYDAYSGGGEDDDFLGNAVWVSSTASGSVGADVSAPTEDRCDYAFLSASGSETAFNCQGGPSGFTAIGVYLASGPGSGSPPAFPSGAALGATTVGSAVHLNWPQATGDAAIINYTLSENGTVIARPTADTTSATVNGLVTGTSYDFSLVANDSNGNVSAPLTVDVSAPTSTPVTPVTPAPVTPAPLTPTVAALLSPSLGAAAVSGYAASVPVSCAGPADATCTLALTLALTETLKSGKVVAITAKSKPKVKHRTVILGTTTVTVASGAHATESVSLNAAARKLLSHYHHLKVALTATDSTSNTVLAKQVLSFKQAAH